MNEQETNTNGHGEEGETPLAVVKNMTLTQILGKVLVDNGRVNLTGKAAENNTRWVMDVDTDGKNPLVIQLLQYRSGAPVHPDLLSFAIAPTSVDAWKAKPWAEVDGGKLTIHTLEIACSFRLSIDVMHSATR